MGKSATGAAVSAQAVVFTTYRKLGYDFAVTRKSLAERGRLFYLQSLEEGYELERMPASVETSLCEGFSQAFRERNPTFAFMGKVRVPNGTDGATEYDTSDALACSKEVVRATRKVDANRADAFAHIIKRHGTEVSNNLTAILGSAMEARKAALEVENGGEPGEPGKTADPAPIKAEKVLERLGKSMMVRFKRKDVALNHLSEAEMKQREALARAAYLREMFD